MGKSWYSIKNLADNETEVVLYDEISYWGVTAKDFIAEFKKIPANNTIVMRINSPGGDVFDGLAIYNVIARHPGQVNVTIDGLAASMASVIAMAGNSLSMPENAFLMIHDPWGFSIGSADELRDMADVLDKIKSSLITTYANKSGQSAEKLAELMSAETWLTAQEAKDLGFADEVTPTLKLAAAFSLDRFSKLPESFRAGLTPKTQQPTTEQVRAEVQKEIIAINSECAAAGVPEYAAELIEKNTPLAKVREQLAPAAEIRGLCLAARLPNRASAYIKSGLTLEEVRAELLAVGAARDKIEIDNKLDPDVKAKKPAATDISTGEIYALRKKWAQQSRR